MQQSVIWQAPFAVCLSCKRHVQPRLQQYVGTPVTTLTHSNVSAKRVSSTKNSPAPAQWAATPNVSAKFRQNVYAKRLRQNALKRMFYNVLSGQVRAAVPAQWAARVPHLMFVAAGVQTLS
jgi:hypothetical protein